MKIIFLLLITVIITGLLKQIILTLSKWYVKIIKINEDWVLKLKIQKLQILVIIAQGQSRR